MSFSQEMVPRMPPMRISTLEAIGSAIAHDLGIRFGVGRAIVDWSDLVHSALPKLGVHVYAVNAAEIGDAEGATDPDGAPGDSINILLRDDVYEDVDQAGSAANRAHGTLLHEVSHALLHVPLIRRRARTPRHAHELMLKRVSRSDLRAFEDPEWQAWTLAGCIIAPREALRAEHGLATPEMLAPMFGVSSAFLKQHMRKLNLLREGRR